MAARLIDTDAIDYQPLLVVLEKCNLIEHTILYLVLLSQALQPVCNEQPLHTKLVLQNAGLNCQFISGAKLNPVHRGGQESTVVA